MAVCECLLRPLPFCRVSRCVGAMELRRARMRSGVRSAVGAEREKSVGEGVSELGVLKEFIMRSCVLDMFMCIPYAEECFSIEERTNCIKGLVLESSMRSSACSRS